MTITERDRRALLLLGAAAVVILIVRFGVMSDGPAVAEAAGDTVQQAEAKLTKLRKVAATVPGKEAVALKAKELLSEKEKGLIQAETAQQAQAQLLQVIRRIGKAENIDARGGEFGPVKPLGDDYGEVTVAVSFDCAIEQLVNFLAALTTERELLATSDIRISAGNAKQKTVGVRLALSGVVSRKLVPEKKASSLF